MVASLVQPAGDHPGGAPVIAAPPGGYERQISCQVWSLDGHMMARSSGAPEGRFTDAPAGFSEREIGGDAWRIFTVDDPAKGIRVMAGDRLGSRQNLVTDLVMVLLTPILLAVPLIGLLIWTSLGRGLRPLRRMARNLAARGADDMSAIDAGCAHAEIRPVADALNGLFSKVEAARRHEREVTAFAAHELRTPLAGLKTQAQVALVASDPDVVRGALRQIIAGVDRTTRLVRQLLDAAKLDAETADHASVETDVGALIAEAVDGVRQSPGIRTLIDPRLKGFTMKCDLDSLRLAIRNLHENAVQHMQAGLIEWCVCPAVEGSTCAMRDRAFPRMRCVT